jgi:hypothetical protein
MVDRNEVEKVYIRRGILNEDGERLDVVVSKTAGREYQANVLIGKTYMWAWRLRQPQDTTNVSNIQKPPLPHLSRPCEPESRAHPPHIHQAQSPLPRQSTLPPNSERTPDLAGEYSMKRGEGSLQPRFHMSWGAHWKGKSGARSFHFASASQSQLNGQALLNQSFPISRVSNDDPVSENRCASDREGGGSGSCIVDQLPRQHFEQPREATSLDNSGFGSRRAQSHQACRNYHNFASRTRRKSHHQRDGNTSSDSGEWYGLVSRPVPPPPQTHYFKPRKNVNPSRTGSFGLRGPKKQDLRNLGSSVSRTVTKAASQVTQMEMQRETREVRPHMHKQDDIGFGLKQSQPSLDDDNHPVSVRARTSTGPSKQPVPPFQPKNKLLEEETAFGLKRSLQDQSPSGSNSSASRVFPEPVSRGRTWSDAVEPDMPFGLKRPPLLERQSHTTSPANCVSEEKSQLSRSFDRPREYASAHTYMRRGGGGVLESFEPKKPRPAHQTDVEGDVSAHTVDQQTSQPGSSSEHYEGVFNRGEARRGDRASGWNRPQKDQVISSSHASSEPAKLHRSDWDSACRLGRSVNNTRAALDDNSGHAWEEASLKVLLQADKSENNAVEFSTRDIDRILPRASESSQWHRDPSSAMSPARRPAKSASEQSVVDSSTGDPNHQLSPSDSSRWYRKLNGGMWTFGVPNESSNTSSDPSAPRKPDVPFSQRLRQSRAAITKQVHKQLNLYAAPIQSAIGHLPLYQSQNSASTQAIAAVRRRGPPIICAVVGSSEQQPQEQPKRTYDFPSFPTVPL